MLDIDIFFVAALLFAVGWFIFDHTIFRFIHSKPEEGHYNFFVMFFLGAPAFCFFAVFGALCVFLGMVCGVVSGWWVIPLVIVECAVIGILITVLLSRMVRY